MRLLIVGGTIFLGKHLVEAALAAGHEVTLFNRGRHSPELFPDVERLRGDRERADGLAALQGRRWDAAIDTCGYVPRVVRASAALLADAVEHYTFISSISVYADANTPGQNETAPVGTLPDESVEAINGDTYGPLKVLCERAVEAAMPGRALVIRPGLIVGPDDPSDRFTYWPNRVAQGGEVLAPGRPERVIQFIDVRDLSGWTLRMVEQQAAGTYNADGPEEPLPMSVLLETCRIVSGSAASFTWVDEAQLADAGVTPWTEMPLWVPEAESAGFFRFDCGKAIAKGLTFRSPRQIVADTLAWDSGRPAGTVWRAGLSRARETAVLENWHERTGGWLS